MNKFKHPCDGVLAVAQHPFKRKSFHNTFFKGMSFLLFLVALSTSVFAQSIVITGKVIDEKNLSLPGVTITTKASTAAAVTQTDGTFSISAALNDALVFTYTGYARQEAAINGRSVINITLLPETSALNEVLVVGYVAQKRADITSAISVINTADLEKVTGTTVAEKLQGRAPGVRVRTSGTPGQTAEIEIRGVNNFRGTSPLYVIDGLLTNETRDINPNDIETIQILKDAGAAALYGSRAANGVVVITTKKGKAGPARVEFDSRYGIQNIGKSYDVMETAEWSNLVKSMYTNSGEPIPASAANPPAGINTDWQNALIKQGNIQDYNFGLSGGSEQSTYRFSGGYFSNDGTTAGPKFERYTARLNGALTRGRFKFNQSLLTSISNSTDPTGNPFVNALRMLPVIPVYDAANSGGFGFGSSAAPTLGENPIAQQMLNRNTNESLRIQGTINGEYAITDFLSYKVNFGLEYNTNIFAALRKEGAWFWSQSPTNSVYAEDRNRFRSTLFEHTLNFNKTLGKHSVNGLVGFTDQFRTFTNSFGKTERLAVNSSGDYFDVLGSGQSGQGVNGGRSESAIRSVLGRIDYNYADKYILSASIRRDGSSRFGEGNRWGNFPSISAGWRITNEEFAKNTLPSFISDLKVRGSYGTLGNTENIGDYDYQAYINTFSRYILGTGQQVAGGSIERNLVNSNIRWESTETKNFGIDLGLFTNALQVTADYYIKKTTDILLNAPIPWTAGNAGGDPLVNIGSLQNKGFDFGITYRNRMGEFTYNVNANLSTVASKVLQLTNDDAPLYGANTKTEVGQPIGQFFLLQTDGIFQNQQEIDASAQKDAKPGDQRYKDINGRNPLGKLTGAPDGKIDADDRMYSGSPWPDFTYGANLEVGYKEFDFSMFWNGVQGGTLYNQQNVWLSNTADLGNYKAGLTPWTPENRSTTVPRAVHGAAGVVRGDTDRWVEDGSFLRLGNVQLGYTIPKNVLDKLKMNRVRLYVSGQNLVTFTSYSGLDPDIKGGGILSRGYDNGSYPNVKSWIAGIQVGF